MTKSTGCKADERHLAERITPATEEVMNLVHKKASEADICKLCFVTEIVKTCIANIIMAGGYDPTAMKLGMHYLIDDVVEQLNNGDFTTTEEPKPTAEGTRTRN